MGGSALTSPETVSFARQFDEAFPYYLSIGMSYEQFWCDRPELCIAYRKADRMMRQRENENMWLQGVYMCNALSATVGNMFSKGRKKEYPRSPLPIFAEDVKTKQEQEREVKVEKAKAGMMAFAEQFNKRIAHAAPPQEVVTSGDNKD